MARRVFFSFHYQRDIWRMNIVRNSNMIDGAAAAGWHDASLWEEAKAKGPAAVQRLIDGGLAHTTVTVVCIGALTAGRRWVDYEIDKSIERGNKLLGLRINHLKAPPANAPDPAGIVPKRLAGAGARVVTFTTADALGREVEGLFAARPRLI
jgi:hypothetical protein